ncbi:ABC transporter permease [Streptomyces sp. NPDC002490]|uniref:ABC transporter permease n=1 Tax=Streptomyces sp. NPDC002490 TaxID=3154416 RepID=UPI0033302735
MLRAEARLFRREPGNLFWIVGFPPGLLAILGSVPMFREVRDDLDGLRLIDLYVPVTVLVGLIMASMQALPPVLTGYRERGVLRRMSTTPVRPSALLSAQMTLIGTAALFSALLSLAVGRWAFDVPLPGRPAGYALALLLGVAVAVGMGALVAAVARTAKSATAISSAVFFPMLFCAGVWLPVQAMPDLLARIVGFTPYGAAALALGEAGAGDWPAWSRLAVLAGWAVALSAGASRWFRWE